MALSTDSSKLLLRASVVLVEFEDDIGPCRTLYETVEFSHFCLYEFDELPVGIEFNCLNLYVHN